MPSRKVSGWSVKSGSAAFKRRLSSRRIPVRKQGDAIVMLNVQVQMGRRRPPTVLRRLTLEKQRLILIHPPM